MGKFKKILLLDFKEETLESKFWERINALCEGKILLPKDSPEIKDHLADTDCILVNFLPTVDKERIDKMPNLRYIGILATGFGRIDSSHAATKGIPVCNIPDYSTESVAEFAIATILEHTRELERGKKQAREGNYSEESFTATEIKGKPFGIIGLGNIGYRIAEIAFKASGRHGKAQGNFYFTGRPFPEAGVHIYVNGWRVGDPKSLLHGAKLKHNIVGIVDANGLEDAVLLNPRRFKEDHPGYKALSKRLAEFVKNIGNTQDRDLKRALVDTSKAKVPDIIAQAERYINLKISEMLPRKHVEIQLGTTPDGVPSVFDPEKNTVYLDAQTPQLSITTGFHGKAYLERVIDLTLDAIVAGTSAKKATVAQFIKRKQELAQLLYTPGAGAIAKQPAVKPRAQPAASYRVDSVTTDNLLNRSRMYTSAEIAKVTKLLPGVVHKLRASRALKTDGDKVKGSDVLGILDRIKGYTSLYTIAYTLAHSLHEVSMLYDSLTTEFEKVATGIPFVKNVSKKKQCYFIKNQFVDSVTEMIRTKRAKHKRGIKRDALNTLMERDLSVSDLGQHLGISEDRTQNVIRSAARQGLPITRHDSGSPLYNYFYATVAMSNMEKTKGG